MYGQVDSVTLHIWRDILKLPPPLSPPSLTRISSSGMAPLWYISLCTLCYMEKCSIAFVVRFSYLLSAIVDGQHVRHFLPQVRSTCIGNSLVSNFYCVFAIFESESKSSKLGDKIVPHKTIRLTAVALIFFSDAFFTLDFSIMFSNVGVYILFSDIAWWYVTLYIVLALFVPQDWEVRLVME